MEGVHLTDIGVDGKSILRYVPNELDERTWTGLTWRRIVKSDRILGTFGFLICGNFSSNCKPSATKEGPQITELLYITINIL
jgi:hypothetical protein